MRDNDRRGGIELSLCEEAMAGTENHVQTRKSCFPNPPHYPSSQLRGTGSQQLIDRLAANQQLIY